MNISIKEFSEYKGIIIEDVWIATNATLYYGVTISKRSLIPAGALVHKPVPPYSVMAGVPARIIKRREL